MDFNQLTKLYYSIGEVADLLSVSPSLLRYWETQFHSIKPQKDRSGKRRYRVKDIQNIFEVHHLVKEKGYTLEGARNHLNRVKADEETINTVISRLERAVKRLDSLES